MVYDYAAAGQGLKIVFISIVTSICAGVFAILIPLLSVILSIAAPLIAAYGFSLAAKGHPDFSLAMYLSIIASIISLLSGLFAGVFLLGTLLSIAGTVCNALVVHRVCVTTGALLEAGGRPISPNFALVWKLYIGCALASVVITLLTSIPLLGIILAVLLLPISIVLLVAMVLYMVFLWRAQQTLSAA